MNLKISAQKIAQDFAYIFGVYVSVSTIRNCLNNNDY